LTILTTNTATILALFRFEVRAPPPSGRSVRVAANFFKHADRDPGGRVNIEPLARLTPDVIELQLAHAERNDVRAGQLWRGRGEVANLAA